MSDFSNYLENALINATLRNTAYTSPTNVYTALFLTDPTEAGTGTEVTGSGYSRKIATFNAPSNGVTQNSANIEFNQANATWGSVGWVGLYDALTGGNLLYHKSLVATKIIETGDVFRIQTGDLTVTLS